MTGGDLRQMALALEPDELRELIEAAWRRTAPKRMAAAYDAQSN
jgi:hypothetical protein